MELITIGDTGKMPRERTGALAPGTAPGGRSRLALLLATAGGVGCAPVAPGTFGSALAVLLFLPIAALGPAAYAIALLTLFAAGVAAAGAAERIFGGRDDGRIVIDEVVGQLLALAPLLLAPSASRLQRLVLIATGFALFRCFDIWKPGPVRWLERHISGGLGVMLDDVAAAVLAAAALTLLLWASSAVGAPA